MEELFEAPEADLEPFEAPEAELTPDVPFEASVDELEVAPVEDTGQSRLASGTNQLLKSLAEVGTGTLEGLGELSQFAVRRLNPVGWAASAGFEPAQKVVDLYSIPGRKVAEAGKEMGESVAQGLPTNPAYEEEWVAGKIPAVIGQAGGQLGSLLLGGAVGMGAKSLTAMGLSQAGVLGLNSGMKEAERLGVSDPIKRDILATIYAGTEAGSEALTGFGTMPYSKMLAGEIRELLTGNLFKTVTKTAVGEGLEEVAAEVPQNIASTVFSENDAPLQTINPTKADYWSNLAEAFGLGAIAGGVFGGAQAIGDRKTTSAALGMRAAVQDHAEELVAKQAAGQALGAEEQADLNELRSYDSRLSTWLKDKGMDDTLQNAGLSLSRAVNSAARAGLPQAIEALKQATAHAMAGRRAQQPPPVAPESTIEPAVAADTSELIPPPEAPETPIPNEIPQLPTNETPPIEPDPQVETPIPAGAEAGQPLPVQPDVRSQLEALTTEYQRLEREAVDGGNEPAAQSFRQASQTLQPILERWGSAFNGVTFQPGMTSAAGVTPDGTLVLDPAHVAQGLADGRYTEKSLDAAMTEEVLHHLVNNATATLIARETADGQSPTIDQVFERHALDWRNLPQRVRDESERLYRLAAIERARKAQVSGELTEDQIDAVIDSIQSSDAERGSEFKRQVMQGRIFGVLTEEAQANENFAQWLKDFLNDLLLAIKNISQRLTDPQAIKRLDELEAEVRAELAKIDQRTAQPTGEGPTLSASEAVTPESIPTPESELEDVLSTLRRQSERAQAEGLEPALSTEEERTYKAGGSSTSFYRPGISKVELDLLGNKALRLSAQMSGDSPKDFGRKVLAYLKDGTELPGIPPNDPILGAWIGSALLNDMDGIATRLGIDPEEVKQPLNDILTRAGTALGLVANRIYNPLKKLAEDTQAQTDSEMKKEGIDNVLEFTRDIEQKVEEQEKADTKAEAGELFEMPSWWQSSLGGFTEARRRIMDKITENLKKIALIQSLLKLKNAQKSPVPVGSESEFELLEAKSEAELQAELDRLITETSDLIDELQAKKKRTKKRDAKESQKDAEKVIKKAEKSREKAIEKAVNSLKPPKPRDRAKRNKFTNALIKASEDGVLNSQKVRDAFSQAYELHGATEARLEELAQIMRDIESMPDGVPKQTLMEMAFNVLNSMSPSSRVISALYQNLLGGVLGGVSTILAQFSSLSRVINPLQGAWQFLNIAGINPLTSPKLFAQVWGKYLKEAWDTKGAVPTGMEGLLGGQTYGLGVSPAYGASVRPTEMQVARVSPTELYKMRIGRQAWIRALLGTEPTTKVGRSVKNALLFPSWLSSRSFNLIRGAEAWTGTVDRNMTQRALMMNRFIDDGLSPQQAFNKMSDLMNPVTNSAMWEEAQAQARTEQGQGLVSPKGIRQRAEEIMQDRLDEEFNTRLKNRHREMSAWLNFKSAPLTPLGSWFAEDVMGKAPTLAKSLFLFSRFFSNMLERAVFNSPLGFIHMSKDAAAKGVGSNQRLKRIEGIFGSLENYRQYRNGIASSSVASTFVMSTVMALAWAFWRWGEDDEEGKEPPPFWITGSTPPSSPYATGRQLAAQGWWSPNTLYIKIPGKEKPLALNYVQMNPELAITLSAIGNVADRIMFPEMLTKKVDRQTGERQTSGFKTYVQPFVNALAAPASRSTYATFQQSVQRAMEGNWQSLSKLLSRPVGEMAAATVLGGPVVRDIAKLSKADVPKASQDWKQAMASGIPFADAMGLDTGLPMANQFGESTVKFPYFPFMSAMQESSPNVQRAAKILNDSGVLRANPEEIMTSADVVELSHDGKRYSFSLDERRDVLSEIGQRFADALIRDEDKIRGADEYEQKRKIVNKLVDDSRKSVLRLWRDRIRKED